MGNINTLVYENFDIIIDEGFLQNLGQHAKNIGKRIDNAAKKSSNYMSTKHPKMQKCIGHACTGLAVAPVPGALAAAAGASYFNNRDQAIKYGNAAKNLVHKIVPRKPTPATA
jgi:hypothetical protein